MDGCCFVSLIYFNLVFFFLFNFGFISSITILFVLIQKINVAAAAAAS